MVIWPAEVVLVIRYLEGLHVAHHPAQLSEQEEPLSASVSLDCIVVPVISVVMERTHLSCPFI